jgi:hypothetical protein
VDRSFEFEVTTIQETTREQQKQIKIKNQKVKETWQ